jgi:gliding motility-associated-like protein
MRYTSIFLILSTLFSSSLFAQGVYVNEGVAIVRASSYFILQDANLEASGDFHSKDFSKVILRWQTEEGIIEGNVTFQDLIIDGTGNFESSITVQGNIQFNRGIIDIGSNNLSLGGSLVNENADSYITSSSFGEIVKQTEVLDNLSIAPGNMGLSFVSSDSYSNLELRRGHSPQSNGQNEGVNRYYSFDQPVDLQLVSVNYRTEELKGENPDALAIWTENANEWEENPTIANISNEIQAQGFQSSEIISLFIANDGPVVKFPTGFSPNGDGINDMYIIDGIENYPNCRFVVFNQWGDIVFEEAPYQNKWDGKSSKGALLKSDKQLIDGAYFYVFYKNNDNNQDVIKGFFEIKSGN